MGLEFVTTSLRQGGKEPRGALGAGTPLWCPWPGQVQPQDLAKRAEGSEGLRKGPGLGGRENGKSTCRKLKSSVGCIPHPLFGTVLRPGVMGQGGWL